MSKRTKGFTLIELMVAVAILALLSAIAIPIYTRYSDRTYRSEAMADLLDCAQALERRASQTFDYLGAAAGGADDGAIDPAVCQPESAARYDITIVGGAANFALTATPSAPQNVDEGRIVTFNSNGQRGWDENGDGDVADAGEDDWEES